MNKLTTVVLLVLFASVFSMTTAQDNLAPYLYYHSPILNAFIIERADGTDSHMIGEGITPTNHRAYVNPGWSPSGKWLVWTSTVPTEEPADVSYEVWGISADGTQSVTILDDLSLVQSIVWSPVEDLLFLVEKLSNRAMLIDVGSNSIVTSFAMSPDGFHVGNVSWTPDGQYVTFFYGMHPENDPARPLQEFLRVVSRTGEVSDRQASGLGYDAIYRSRPLYSSSGWLLYAMHDQMRLVADNLSTGEKFEMDAPLGEIRQVEWSPSGDYAALFVWMRCDTLSECPYSLWMLSPIGRFLEKVADNINHTFSYDENVFWSPSQDTGAFVDANDRVQLLEAETRTSTQLELPPDDQLELEIPANPRLYWFPSGDRLLLPGVTSQQHQNRFAYEYNLIKDQTIVWRFEGQIPLFSPDGSYAASLWDDPAIYTSFGSRKMSLPRHSGTYYWENLVALYRASWHPIENWLLMDVAHNPFSIKIPTSVIDASGTVYREFGNCSTCIDWLPAQVDIIDLPPGAPTSIIPTPTITFDTGAWVEGLSWSPDGERIAVAQYDLSANDGNQLQLGIQEWDLLNTEPALLFTIMVPKDTQIDWQQIEGKGYILLPDENGKVIELLTLFVDWERDTFAVSPDGVLSVIRNEDHLLGVRDNTSYDFLYTLSFLPVSETSFLSVTFSPDRRLIAGNGPHVQLHLWDATTGELLTVLNVFSNAIAFSADGKWLATGKATEVALWDLTSIFALPEEP